MKQGLKVKITHDQIKLIIYNLICALKYVQSANIIHRDIKPSNILINENCSVKICDFGLSRTLPEAMLGSGSGNTKRMRDSVIKTRKSKVCSDKTIKKSIIKKLNKS